MLARSDGSAKMKIVGILDDQDARWAWNFGLSYGAWYPDLGAHLQTILRGFGDYAQGPLNDTAIAHENWRFKTGSYGKTMTAEQLRSLAPYLSELGATAAQALEIAIYYRRHVWDTEHIDARVEHPHTRGIKRFARSVSAFMASHPELRVYSRTTVTPAQTADASPVFGPPPPAVVGGVPLPPSHAAPSPARPRPEPPGPQPYGVSHAGAEALVAAWMRHLGAAGVRVTQLSGDGGIDVVSRTFIAQVKNLASTSAVPVSAIRDIAGVASVDGRRAAVFTSGGYSTGGISFADSAKIALFRYDAVRGTLSVGNRIAREVRNRGMDS